MEVFIDEIEVFKVEGGGFQTQKVLGANGRFFRLKIEVWGAKCEGGVRHEIQVLGANGEVFRH